MVIAVVGWRMWQVVMVKVDGVWGRLLTERNTGRDRRQGVNGEGSRTQVQGTAEGRRDRQSWAGSSVHGAQFQQQLWLVPAQRGQPAQLGPGDAVCPRPAPSRQPGGSRGSPGWWRGLIPPGRLPEGGPCAAAGGASPWGRVGGRDRLLQEGRARGEARGSLDRTGASRGLRPLRPLPPRSPLGRSLALAGVEVGSSWKELVSTSSSSRSLRLYTSSRSTSSCLKSLVSTPGRGTRIPPRLGCASCCQWWSVTEPGGDTARGNSGGGVGPSEHLRLCTPSAPHLPVASQSAVSRGSR